MTEPLKSLSQERALFVQDKVKESSNIDLKKYKSHAAKLPAMIVSNGLAATLAFVKQNEKEWECLYCQFSEWFKKRKMIKEDQDFLEACLRVDAAEYRRFTREALALAEWFKCLAAVEFKDK